MAMRLQDLFGPGAKGRGLLLLLLETRVSNGIARNNSRMSSASASGFSKTKRSELSAAMLELSRHGERKTSSASARKAFNSSE
jgi:hypothetical protein